MEFIKKFESFDEIYKRKKKGEDYFQIDEYNEFKKIVSIIRSTYKDPNDYDKERLDEISGYKNLYDNTKEWIISLFKFFNKYSIEEIEDRLLEFYDEVPKFKPVVMFSISTRTSSLGISEKKLNHKNYLYEIFMFCIK